MEPIVHPLYERQTGTWQYIVACPETKAAVIIDPVLDLSTSDLQISTASADRLLEVVAQRGYDVVRLLETHAHADHLTAAAYIQKKLQYLRGSDSRVPICTGHRIKQVQTTFAARYKVGPEELENAFDHLFQDGEEFSIGKLSAVVLHLPGHTPDHSGYQIGANVFTGDSIFNPDVGTARCDFPDGDASVLYQSMQTLLSMPPTYKLYTGHDYPPIDSGRDPLPYVTVAEQLERNKHVKRGTKEDEFIAWRRERDAGLKEPKLLHPALQVNIRGGHLPTDQDGNQRTFLLMPIQTPY